MMIAKVMMVWFVRKKFEFLMQNALQREATVVKLHGSDGPKRVVLKTAFPPSSILIR